MPHGKNSVLVDADYEHVGFSVVAFRGSQLLDVLEDALLLVATRERYHSVRGTELNTTVLAAQVRVGLCWVGCLWYSPSGRDEPTHTPQS